LTATLPSGPEVRFWLVGVSLTIFTWMYSRIIGQVSLAPGGRLRARNAALEPRARLPVAFTPAGAALYRIEPKNPRTPVSFASACAAWGSAVKHYVVIPSLEW
jgi:hypothetical protein